jgi:hypothetical protein
VDTGGAQRAPLIRFDVAATTTTVVPMLVGTASANRNLGYAIPARPVRPVAARSQTWKLVTPFGRTPESLSWGEQPSIPAAEEREAGDES